MVTLISCRAARYKTTTDVQLLWMLSIRAFERASETAARIWPPVHSPIFEEDVASVMEVEMDELDRWMGSMKKMSQQEGLPDISEDQDLNPKPSDPEL